MVGRRKKEEVIDGGGTKKGREGHRTGQSKEEGRYLGRTVRGFAERCCLPSGGPVRALSSGLLA